MAEVVTRPSSVTVFTVTGRGTLGVHSPRDPFGEGFGFGEPIGFELRPALHLWAVRSPIYFRDNKCHCFIRATEPRMETALWDLTTHLLCPRDLGRWLGLGDKPVTARWTRHSDASAATVRLEFVLEKADPLPMLAPVVLDKLADLVYNPDLKEWVAANRSDDIDAGETDIEEDEEDEEDVIDALIQVQRPMLQTLQQTLISTKNHLSLVRGVDEFLSDDMSTDELRRRYHRSRDGLDILFEELTPLLKQIRVTEVKFARYKRTEPEGGHEETGPPPKRRKLE